MTKQVTILLAMLMLAWRASAQVGAVNVDLVLEQDQFLSAEDIRVAVKITNFSGQSLQLGEPDNWLSFYVESGDGFTVVQKSSPEVAGAFDVASSLTATKRVNITPHFNIDKPGRYRVVAKVKVPQWQQEIASRAKEFSIIAGTRLQVFEFGVPDEHPTPGAAPEVRKYVLQRATYQKGMKLYFRLTDENETRSFKVFPIAPMVSFSRLEAQVDRFSNLHVLHQTGQKAFNYCVLNPDGQILTRQTHEYFGESRPRLRLLDDGRMSVHGGVQRVSETDIPPSSDLPNTIVPKPTVNTAIPKLNESKP